jgi:anti-anti-sigma regulatory factor
MSTDPKDGDGFFRKVARFVANPTTDWAEINSRPGDPDGEQAKAELRAMVDRKRRNDFVRKRELDMLRRIRREGLNPEQLAALGSSNSRMDEVERSSDLNSRIDLGVKAKIDQIEQQMVGENYANTQPPQPPARPAGFFETSTKPIHFSSTVTSEASGARVSESSPVDELERLAAAPAPAAAVMAAGMSPLSDAKPSKLPDLPPLDMPLSFKPTEPAPVGAPAFTHDAELDEAVIAFANADYDACERQLGELIAAGGARNLHGETWLTLFDLYRASGQAAKFEALALEYAQLFGRSAPQYYSLPRLVAESLRYERAPRSKPGGVSWTAPEQLDETGVQAMRRQCANQPLPWVLDWRALRRIDISAVEPLRALLGEWAPQALDLRWLAGDHVLQLLAAATPMGERSTAPSLWMLRLDVLRLVNRPDQFDEVAIDYCVTYEISPPSWERAVCRVQLSGASLNSAGQNSSTQVTHADTEISTSFMESTLIDRTQLPPTAELELSGQLSGDIGETLQRMSSELGSATQITVNCAKLIRLDFMAAGDLLNWVLSRQGENRQVVFSDTHRLVAQFFGAMGITEHARIKLRAN